MFFFLLGCFCAYLAINDFSNGNYAWAVIMTICACINLSRVSEYRMKK